MAKTHSIAESSVKYNLIADDLRAQIVANVLPAGSQVPTREDLIQHYQVSSVTVQRALDCLIRDGFVDAARRRGSFVVEYPPHLCRYALVLEGQPGPHGYNSRYLAAMVNEAQRVQASPTRTVALYHGIDTHCDSPDYARLRYDLGHDRLAGVIFPDPLHILHTPALDPWPGGVGKVVVRIGPDERGWPTINLDADTFISRALEYLRARGRTRVAILSGQAPREPFHQRMAAAIAAHGMLTRPYWNQFADIKQPETARNCAHLLMMPVLDNGRTERPDALIIADDNLVEHASVGLLASGARVSDEVDVIAHCNFPWPVASVIPVKRLGYDIRQVMDTAIDLVSRQRRCEEVPECTNVSAWFEDELPYPQR